MKLGNRDSLAHGGGLSELLLSEINLMVELLNILLLLFYQALQSNAGLPKKKHWLDLSILTEIGALIVEGNGVERVNVIVIKVSDLCKIQECLIANQFLLIATTIWLFIRLLNHRRGAYYLKSIHLQSFLIDLIGWDNLGWSSCILLYGFPCTLQFEVHSHIWTASWWSRPRQSTLISNHVALILLVHVMPLSRGAQW